METQTFQDLMADSMLYTDSPSTNSSDAGSPFPSSENDSLSMEGCDMIPDEDQIDGIYWVFAYAHF